MFANFLAERHSRTSLIGDVQLLRRQEVQFSHLKQPPFFNSAGVSAASRKPSTAMSVSVCLSVSIMCQFLITVQILLVFANLTSHLITTIFYCTVS